MKVLLKTLDSKAFFRKSISFVRELLSALQQSQVHVMSFKSISLVGEGGGGGVSFQVFGFNFFRCQRV